MFPHSIKITESLAGGARPHLAKRLPLVLAALLFGLVQGPALAGTGDTGWMTKVRYGVFMHYQHRILLGYSNATKPSRPERAEMTAAGWNRLVDGFDVPGFAAQMAEARVGWVIFCLDDHYYAWPCSPNKAFGKYTGFAPGEKCSNRDLIMELADALNAKGIRLIVYYAGLNGYMNEPEIMAGLGDDGIPYKTPPSAETRRKRLEILKEYADRFGSRIAGWWFDGIQPGTYAEAPDDWWTINAIVHQANPKAVIGFNYSSDRQACIVEGIDDFIGGDTPRKQDLTKLTPAHLPAKGGLLWHGKIFCGNIYHGQGTANQYTDQELVEWIKTVSAQGGICTLDWPIQPANGLIKDFGFKQMLVIRDAAKPQSPR